MPVPFSLSPKLIHCQPTLLVIYQSPCRKETHLTCRVLQGCFGLQVLAHYLEIYITNKHVLKLEFGEEKQYIIFLYIFLLQSYLSVI